MNIIQNSGSLGRSETNPQDIDYNRFYTNFSIIGNIINNDRRFKFKKKGGGYIIEYKSNGRNLDNGLNNGSDCHLAFHKNQGISNRFHVKDNHPGNRSVGLFFKIKRNEDRYGGTKFELVIDKKRYQNYRVHDIENKLLNKIENIFENNYQRFLEEQYNNYRYGHGGNRGENTKYTNIEDETYKQKYLKYKKKYLDLKNLNLEVII